VNTNWLIICLQAGAYLGVIYAAAVLTSVLLVVDIFLISYLLARIVNYLWEKNH